MGELKIGLAFSGGGFRAAGYCLGTLSYLDKLKTGERSLLDQVIALSTVSGGTITGARYVHGICRGESVKEIYQSIYAFMQRTDLVSLALDRLHSDPNWKDGRVRSLINAFADIYDQELFKGGKFGELMTDSLHLKTFSFNATEFSNAAQFRFQWSEPVSIPDFKEPPRGIIGNYFIRIPEEAAHEIRLADALAASSCFPGGFEPINFPTDFCYPGSEKLTELSKNMQPVGLMDGGIVDNQGITPLLLADQGMSGKVDYCDENSRALDLLIISDVASPFMKSFVASEPMTRGMLWRLSPLQLLSLNTLMLLASGLGLFYSLQKAMPVWAALSAALLTITLVIYLISSWLLSIPRKVEVPESFTKPLRKLLDIRLGVYAGMIKNRVRSLIKLSGEVFLKHVRSLNYATVYKDKSWKNRRIMTAIYEVAKVPDAASTFKEADDGSAPLLPSNEMLQTAQAAWSMGTTLWFTEDELKKKNMLNCLIATGQFTLCWNLLGYIARLRKDRSNTTSVHEAVLNLEETLIKDWENFMKDPFWLCNAYQSK